MAESADPKWKLPGWRLESRYNNRVLIGNWEEERRKFERGMSYHNSTHRADFKNYGRFKPDTSIRRRSMIRNEGIGKQYILAHHDSTYNGNCISWYDQQFNKREQKESKLPPIRKWDGKILAYVPERSDFPLLGPPTNFGLHQKLLRKWKEQEKLEDIGEFSTTYTLSFSDPLMMDVENDKMRPLKSSPQRWSSKLHPHKINKDLHLRELQTNTAPERQTILAV